MHFMETLPSHEATGGGFVNGNDATHLMPNSHDNDSVEDVVPPDSYSIKHVFVEVCCLSNAVLTQTVRDFGYPSDTFKSTLSPLSHFSFCDPFVVSVTLYAIA